MINENELPKNWELVNSSDILDIRDGTHDTPKYVENNGIPLITSKNLKENKIDFQKVSYISQEDHIEISKRSKVEEGDILFAMIGTIGNPVVVRKSQEFSIKNVGLFKKNEKKILPEFLVNYLRSRTFEKQLNDRKLLKGTTQKFIPLGNLRNIYLPLPPLAEQERIVAKIEELFSELDAGLESLKTAQAQLKTYRQAVLKYAFEGKLTNDNVNEGELPNGWKWEKLSDLTEKISDGPFGSNLKSVDYVDEGVRVIRLENIGVLEFKDEYKTFVTEEKYKTISRHTVTKGDIIFSSFIADQIRVTILPDFIEKAINKADCFCVRTTENTINRKFLVFFLATKALYNQLVNEVHGATRPRINTTQLKSSLIPVCSLEEQQRIVEEIESRLSVCDKLEETISASLKQAEALRQSILKQAFEGKLVKPKEIQKPKRTPFYQMQTLGLIIDRSKQRNLRHGEMTLAKYAFLADKIYGVPIYDKYERWHLGPYPTAIKKTVNSREYFKTENNTIRVLNEEKLFKYNNDYKQQIETAVDELAEIFLTFEPKDRSHKTELLATVCKVIEDIQTTEIKSVRQSLAEWKIDLKDKIFNNKAEKFDENETAKCVKFIIEKGWDERLIK